MNNYPKNILFKEPPFGIVTVSAGQLGYAKKTTIRLRRDEKGVYFELKDGTKYREKKINPCQFDLEI